MGRLVKRYIDMMVKALEDEGKEIIQRAIETKETQVRTGNQTDAYGYVIYYNGERKAYGYSDPEISTGVHKGWRNVGDNTGRGWLMEFIQNYHVPANGKFVLVIVNAAFYTNILERGGGNLTKKYRVISQVSSDVDQLAQKYNGKSSYLTYQK